MAGVLNSDELIKVIVLLFLLLDPFGNIPFILSLLINSIIKDSVVSY